MKRQAKKPSGRKGTATDIVVGSNVRRLRVEADLTLAELAAALGISHQQLQKYETGANRVSAGMLYELARVFALPVDALFDGSEDLSGEDPELVRARRKCHSVIDRMSSPEKLEMMSKVIRSMAID